MQNEGADRKLEARLAKRNKLGIGGDSIPRAARQKSERGVGSDHPLDSWLMRERARQRATLGADIERRAKSPAEIFEALDEPACHFGVQELDAAAARGAVTVHSPSVTVEEGDRIWGFHHRSSL